MVHKSPFPIRRFALNGFSAARRSRRGVALGFVHACAVRASDVAAEPTTIEQAHATATSAFVIVR
jgi:hypothetical protein